MQKHITRTLSALLLGLSVNAAAGEGFYLSASIGSANLDDDFDGLSIDDDTTAYRFTAGWQANRYLGLEAGYQNFGDFEQNFSLNGVTGKAKLSADGYTLGVAGRYPLGEKFEVIARAGAFFWDGEAEINSVSQADPGDTNPWFSAGLGYRFTEAFSATADWTRYELEDTESDVYAIGVQYRFGR
jgi:OOP family OmpA-OmpF porin